MLPSEGLNRWTSNFKKISCLDITGLLPLRRASTRPMSAPPSAVEWQSARTSTGEPYWVNAATGESSWTPPGQAGDASTVDVDLADPEVADGAAHKKDDDDDLELVQVATHKNRWVGDPAPRDALSY